MPMKDKNLPEWLHGHALTPIEWNGRTAYAGNLPTAVLAPNDGQLEGVPSNPREWTRSDLDCLRASMLETPELLLARGCIVTPDPASARFVILGGNMRYCVARELRYSALPCVVIPPTCGVDTMRQIVIKDNGAFGSNDWYKLANEWDDMPLTDWGLKVWNPTADGQETNGSDGNAKNENNSGNTYTKKITSPIYEPKGEQPALADLVDMTRADELIAEIDASTIPEDEKSFLRLAAYRHAVFNYARIAEYYAHATKPMQELMENSALVIIDFNKAIELGYVKLSDAICKEYMEEYGDEK